MDKLNLNTFGEVIHIIKQARKNALKAVNTELINLYWNVGAYISTKISSSNWGDKTVDELAKFIQTSQPDLKGFSKSNLFRMKQFYEIYSQHRIVASARRQLQDIDSKGDIIVASTRRQLQNENNEQDIIVSSARTQLQNEQNSADEIVSLAQFEITDIRQTVLVKLSWTHHRTIFSRCKTDEEREFYIRLSIKDNYTVKELDRQITAAVFERTMLSKTNTSPVLEAIAPNINQHFKDAYVFEFLNLPEPYTENDLKKGLIQKMKTFLLELGKDFLFVSEEFRVQVGSRDFYIDLLFYHRELQCLVAFELKNTSFEPEHLGKLNFYLEALDRDVKKANENPSIGILLCKDKEHEVVEYALSRQLSPTLVSQYELALPDKKLLQAKLHELFEMWEDKLRESKI